MRNWIIGLFIIASTVIALALGLNSRFEGLRYYVRALQYINGLEGTEKTRVSKDFFGDPNRNEYGGILVAIPNKGVPGIWILGKGGLKFFRVDEYSVYSFYEGCTQEIFDAMDQKKFPLKIERKIVFDINQFASLMRGRRGLFVTIMIAGSENGGTLGNLREIWVNDWWGFMEKDKRTECEK